MRDKETVDIGLKAALTGHLVFSTLHTNDAPSTITRLQNMGTPDYLISAACQLVVAQRLARKNCKECRVPDDDVTPKVLQDLGFTAELASRVKAVKGKGCKTSRVIDIELVGTARFELATYGTQNRRATRLRYAPTKLSLYNQK